MYKQLEMYFAEWNYEDFNLQLIPVIEHVSTCTFKCHNFHTIMQIIISYQAMMCLKHH